MTCIYILKINNNNIGYYFNYELAREFLYSCYYANFIKDTDNLVIETFKQNTNIKIHTENIYLNISTNTKTNTETKTKTKTKNKTNNKTNNLDDLESFSNSSNSTKTSISSKYNVIDELESDTDSEINSNYISSDYESTKSAESAESTFSEFMKKREDNKKKNKLINEIGQEKIDVTYHINLLKQEKKKLEEKENEYKYDLGLYEKFKKLKETNTNFKIPELFINKYNIFTKLEDANELSFDNFIILYQPEVISTDYDTMFSAPSHYKSQVDDYIIDNSQVDNSQVCEDFVDEKYDNLFMVSHNLSSKPVSETETESELDSSDIERVTSDSDNNNNNNEYNCDLSTDSD